MPDATATGTVTALLIAHREGVPGAFDRLVELIYPELRRVARSQLRRTPRPDALLDTTGLVHETYVKLVDHTRLGARDRAHFLAVAAHAMRQIIIDHARTQQAAKRGAGAAHLPIDEIEAAVQARADHLLAVDQALARLGQVDPRLVHIVECRFFAGYTDAETAEALDVSARTVGRDWLRARAWLRDALDDRPVDAATRTSAG
jgi:RNA polymerase sigma factor (TIGR02999 family)